MQLEHKGGRRQSTQGDRGVASLETPKRVTADEKAPGHVTGGYPAPTPRQGQVAPKLAKRGSGWQRDGSDLRHGFNVSYN
jgi:hypothetical protein